MSCAWLFNLDAELELADPDGYRPSSRMRARIAERAAQLLPRIRSIAGHECDVVVRDDMSGDVERLEGVAWCPTPGAIARMRSLGLHVDSAPDLSVLQRVNHRAFCAQLGQELPGARFVTSLDQLDAVLEGPGEGHGWLLKRPFGFSGRWRKRVPSGRLRGDARTWATASMTGYGCGLQVEPWVTIEREFVVHGLLERSGGHRCGRPLVLETQSDGAWERDRPCAPGEIEASEERALADVGARVAAALSHVGYFGPFGVDAFRWIDSRGVRRFRSHSDVNARYTMGWWIGMDASRS